MANKQAMKFLKNPIGENFEKYVLPIQIEPVKKIFNNILKNKLNNYIFELKLFDKNKNIHDVEISSGYFNYRGKSAILASFRNSSEKNKDLNAAAQHQLNSLQKPFPMSNKIQMEVLYLPARVVGGDFYYFYKIDEENIIGFLGDVCGKGFKAALSVSALEILFHETAAVTQNALEIIRKINERIAYYFADNYIAAICFSFNFKLNEAIIVSAGINQFVYQEYQKLANLCIVKGSYLGMFEDNTFDEFHISFNVGDRFSFFTDGLEFTLHEDKINKYFEREKSLLEIKSLIANNLTDTLLSKIQIIDDCTLLLFEINEVMKIE
jgi:phosphoserine phosphatase RsbU/P